MSTSIRKFAIAGFGLAVALMTAGPGQAGGIQDITNLTGFEPSPINEGEFIAPIVPLSWDSRCLPVQFRVNDTLDPVPNPLGSDFLSVDQVANAFQQAADQWNEIPTSFFEAQVVGTVDNPGLRGFDQVNEITFRTFPNVFPNVPAVIFTRDFEPILIARPTRSLIDSFFPNGADIDRDGDPDVSNSIATCQDVDGDLDLEFPEGFYPAGTIFDVDIILNAGVSLGETELEGLRFTVDPTAVDADPRSVDLVGVAIHALGIAHGISHASTSQTSLTDGRSATMYPFVDTSDPSAELALREIDQDAAATVSFLYPEGSTESGPGALQAEDVAFDDAFGILRGEVFHGERDEPLVGASVLAIDSSGRLVSSAISGQSRFSTDGITATFVDADFHVLGGRYEIPVPPGTYTLLVEATDGAPADGFHFNLQGILGDILGQDSFAEDFYNGPLESAVELRPQARVPVSVQAGEVVSGLDIITNRRIDVANFGSLDDTGFLDGNPGSYLAVRIPAEQVAEADSAAAGSAILHGMSFFTVSPDDSVVPTFAEALLTTGTVNADGTATLDLDRPLHATRPFRAQDFDFSPIWFDESVGLAQRIREGIQDGRIDNLFLVLQLPDPLITGASGLPPQIGIDGGTDNDAPLFGLSYTSEDGETFSPVEDLNFLFKLTFSPSP